MGNKSFVKIKKSNFKDEDFRRSERRIVKKHTDNYDDDLKDLNFKRQYLLNNEDKLYKFKEY
jgi:hypothetical protein